SKLHIEGAKNALDVLDPSLVAELLEALYISNHCRILSSIAAERMKHLLQSVYESSIAANPYRFEKTEGVS
ncbi:MAG: hypothetical protein Q7R79_03700, partial [bacterium]|nr:hypothetical protein [bacterium]